MNNIIVNGTQVIPSKIVCIGRNYVDHIHELGNEVPDDMVVFNKPNSAISAQLNSIHQEQLHYESELCFVVKESQFVAVGFGLDLTKRGLQSILKAKGLPWERAKAFNGAAVFSEFVSIDTIDDSLSLELCINGEIIQAGGVNLMMYKPKDILAELLSYTTLEDGDIVMTGTPKGVGKIIAGDVFLAKVFQGSAELISQQWLAK